MGPPSIRSQGSSVRFLSDSEVDSLSGGAGGGHRLPFLASPHGRTSPPSLPSLGSGIGYSFRRPPREEEEQHLLREGGGGPGGRGGNGNNRFYRKGTPRAAFSLIYPEDAHALSDDDEDDYGEDSGQSVEYIDHDSLESGSPLVSHTSSTATTEFI